MTYRIMFLALTLSAYSAHAVSNQVTLYTPSEIKQVMRAVPVGNDNLLEVMSRLDLVVSNVRIAEADEGDVNDGTFTHRKGDKFFDFKIKDLQGKRLACALSNEFRLTLRKGQYLAESRTSNFLINSKCEGPE
ncbi:MAG: hypothetical protein V4754_16195 [Pseudomonadota bacterium]